ncbi:MAG: peptidylprolyl isomerase [Deltaproteobacteria bacterium]|nr:peptidylprolyl isomerase [Deltaproteobacteria bacterium]
MRTYTSLFSLMVLAAACSRSTPESSPKAEAACPGCPVCAADLPGPATAASGDVLATVNGVAITTDDVRFSLRNRTRNNVPLTADQETAALEQIIQRELAAQQAVRKGMHADAAVVRDLAEIEVQRNSLRRERLADLYFRRQVLDPTRPTEAEVQELWEREQKQIRTEYHVLQLFGRDEAQMTEAQAALKRGEAVGAVYLKLTKAPALGEARPWDLGFLKFHQMPPQWREVLPRLKPGETSDLIRGPNHRFWLVQLVDVRVNEALQLSDIRATLEEDLATAKREKVRTQVESDLNKTATIERKPAAQPGQPMLPPPPAEP